MEGTDITVAYEDGCEVDMGPLRVESVLGDNLSA